MGESHRRRPTIPLPFQSRATTHRRGRHEPRAGLAPLPGPRRGRGRRRRVGADHGAVRVERRAQVQVEDRGDGAVAVSHWSS